MKGLYVKYEVEKVDGTPIDDNAQYFVLSPDTDRHARIALAAYAESVRMEDPQLSGELAIWLSGINLGSQDLA